jgi:hypothetical protein
MPFKTCPQCSKPAGVRTLRCACGWSFQQAQAQAQETPKPRPQAVPKSFPDKPDCQGNTSQVQYDEQGQAVLENGATVAGKLLRPVVYLRLSHDSMASLSSGGCVPALIDGREVYLQAQILEK